MGWLEGWSKRKRGVIKGSTAGAQTDYQMKITVHKGSGTDSSTDVYCDGNCRDDFGDIRWTEEDGTTLLDYWIEDVVSGDYAVFWVKVPSIPADPGTAVVLMYYGNPDATSISSGEDTFVFFDDFSSDPADRWTVVEGTAEWDSANEWYKITSSSSDDHAAHRAIATSMTAIEDMEVLMKVYLETPEGSAHDAGPLGRMVDNDNGYGVRIQEDDYISIRKIEAGNSDHIQYVSKTIDTQNWYWVKLQIFGDTIRTRAWKVGTTEPTSWDVSVSDTSFSGKGKIGVHHDRASDPSRFDDIRVRKYVDPEPTWDEWGEETGPPDIRAHDYLPNIRRVPSHYLPDMRRSW